jgi:hypothetical protein
MNKTGSAHAEPQVMGGSSEPEAEHIADFAPLPDPLELGTRVEPIQERAAVRVLPCVDGLGGELGAVEVAGFAVDLGAQVDAIDPDALDGGEGVEGGADPGLDDGPQALVGDPQRRGVEHGEAIAGGISLSVSRSRSHSQRWVGV